jgi:hypothetical protein
MASPVAGLPRLLATLSRERLDRPAQPIRLDRFTQVGVEACVGEVPFAHLDGSLGGPAPPWRRPP